MSDIPFHPHRSPVFSSGGMVAASQPTAVVAGLDALRDGGNAADAAVAAAAAIAVTEPTSCGLGGDCFALYYDAASGRVSALNGSGRAPKALTLDRLRADGVAERLPPFHAHTVTVPGAVRGWHDLLERHGALSLAHALAPAVELAARGFVVAPKTAHAWRRGAMAQLQFAVGGRAMLVADGDGHRAPRPGELFRNPGLARTLRAIADAGPGAYYTGAVADAIASAVTRAGGAMTAADLAAHRSAWVAPIAVDYRGIRIHECPPNGQGLAALVALGVLDSIALDAGVRAADTWVGLSADRLHAVIEAIRLGFADALAHVADPEHAEVDAAALLAPERLAALARQVADRVESGRATTGPCVPPGPPGSDTVYLATADAQGNACSFIQSNYMGFGTGIVPEGCGFTLQNRGHNFSLDPGHPNALAPGKRPYRTIIPAMATRADGTLFASFGVMGGFMQPQGHVQVATGMIDDGLDPQLALDRPRVHLDPFTGAVTAETGVPGAVVGALVDRGFSIRTVSGHDRAVFGRGQIIVRDPDTGVLSGGSDLRGDGLALGA